MTDSDTNNDYKRLWEALRQRLLENSEMGKRCAIKEFEASNKNNFENPVESKWFIENMVRFQSAEETIGLMNHIEIQELLFMKHEEKRKAHFESNKGD